MYKYLQDHVYISNSQSIFSSLQTFQQKVIAERSTWTVAHLADSGPFPDGALLPNVALVWKQSVNGKCVILIGIAVFCTILNIKYRKTKFS